MWLLTHLRKAPTKAVPTRGQVHFNTPHVTGKKLCGSAADQSDTRADHEAFRSPGGRASFDGALADELGDRVVARIGRFAPNVPAAVIARQVLTPLDLEREYGLTEGNIFHGDIAPDQLFHMRPVPGWARYATPVPGLYLCGAGAHPGGGVTGAPGYNAARRVLADLRRGRRRPSPATSGATPAREA